MSNSSQTLATRILWGLLAGVALGSLALALGSSRPELLAPLRQFSTSVLDPAGRIFLHLLFFVVIPLVFSSLVLSAVAVAGIPGASLPLIAGLLVIFGVPPEGIAIILGVDRLLDMARTTLNVAADVVTAAIVDERK